MTLVEWADEVAAYFEEVERAEENAHIQRGRKRCPFCGTKDRDDDDGSWWHDNDCVAEMARYFLGRYVVAREDTR